MSLSKSASISTPNRIHFPEESDDNLENCRLWIGNLDKRLTVFHFLKLIQPFGKIDSFDFVCHKNGQPRGYAFVTYKSEEAAQSCLENLNGKCIIQRKVIVKRAHQNLSFEQNRTRNQNQLQSQLPVLGIGTATKQEEPEVGDLCLTRKLVINAIEDKLRAMQAEKDRNNFKPIKNSDHTPTFSTCTLQQQQLTDSNGMEDLVDSRSLENNRHFNNYSRIQWKPYYFRCGRRRRF